MEDNEARAYERGVRDGEIHAIRERITSIEKDMKEWFTKMTNELDTLKKAVWALYGAIALVGFVLPLFQKWVTGA